MAETSFINGIYLFCMGIIRDLADSGSANGTTGYIMLGLGWYVTAFPAKSSCWPRYGDKNSNWPTVFP